MSEIPSICKFSSHSFKTGMTAGLWLAELIRDSRAQWLDISAFDLSCFAEDKEIEGEHTNEDFWR